MRLAFPFFRLIDFLLSRERIARYLFDNFRTKDNLKNVLKVRCSAVHCIFEALQISTGSKLT